MHPPLGVSRLVAFTLALTVAACGGGSSAMTEQPDVTPANAACTIFPADNAWNTDVSAYPLHPNSADFIASIDACNMLIRSITS